MKDYLITILVFMSVSYFTTIFSDGQDGAIVIDEDLKTKVVLLLLHSNSNTFNLQPVADAGTDINVDNGSLVILDASGSTDPDGDALTYSWTLDSKPADSLANLTNSSSVKSTLVADVEGIYNATLIVSDGELNSKPDTVTVTSITSGVTNVSPVADAGSDMSVDTGSQVTLDASGSLDPDGDILTYTWTLDNKPEGSLAILSNANSLQATFIADVDGSYNVSLVVNDGSINSLPDSIVIIATTLNAAPIADAGSDMSVDTGSQIILNGSGSSDPDEDVITYTWKLESKPDGSSSIINNSDLVQATFIADLEGIYTASLIVNDGSLNSAPDIIVITAATTNTAPVADAGIDMNVETGSDVTLNGSGSSDPDGDALTYSWTLDSKPADSLANFTNSTSVQASFVADVDGTYTASLVVNDGNVNSTPNSIVVTASTSGTEIALREPSPINIKQIHSGHSLTDAAMFVGNWPKHGVSIWTDVDPAYNYVSLIGKSTIPGSSLKYRWENAPGFGAPDARNDIANWELLIITEGVPFNLWDGTEPGSAWYTNQLDYMRLFVENAWNNGNDNNGIATLLYATWGKLDTPDLAQWRADLDTHQPLWEQMADYGSENLPAGANVYIIPANLLMKRIYDDIAKGGIVPSVTSMNDFFDDNIHPNGLGSYAIALLHLAVIHHINPNTLPDPDYGLAPQPTPEQADYLKAVVWEIATSYERTGVPKN